MILEQNIPKDENNKWRHHLDEFVQAHKQELAAISWGLSQEWGDTKETLGIDLKPKPHFVCCPRQALDDLNHKLDRKIQEILGILDGQNPEEEVAIIAIGNGQIKLIYFKPEPTPRVCFEQKCTDLALLIEQIEHKLNLYIK